MTSGVCMQRLIQSMDSMSLDAFIYPGWGNPPRLIGDLSQAGHTVLGAPFMTILPFIMTPSTSTTYFVLSCHDLNTCCL